MKKLFKILLPFVVAYSICLGQTNVSGLISTNTTWDPNGSPYIIIDNVAIMDGVTLTISPGTNIIFNQDVILRVLTGGTLISAGTKTYSIFFSAKDTSLIRSKSCILFDSGAIGTIYDVNPDNDTQVDTSGSVFVYCSFLNFKSTNEGVINTNDVDLLFKSCVFKNNMSLKGAALFMMPSNSVFLNTKFINNVDDFGGAIYVEQGDLYKEIKFINCVVEKNTGKQKGGFYLSGDSRNYYFPNLYVESCKFSDNSSGHGGVFYVSASWCEKIKFINSEFYNNTATSGFGGVGNFYSWSPSYQFITCKFINNSSAGEGGTLFLTQKHTTWISPEESYVYNCLFKNNKSDESIIYTDIGSQIEYHEYNKITFNGNIFYNNCTFNGELINSLNGLFFYNNHFINHLSNTNYPLIYANMIEGNGNSFWENDNKILVYLQAGSTITLNMKNNYWDTKNEIEINSKIVDFYDDVNYNTPRVEYLPFLLAPPDSLPGTPTLITDISIKTDSTYLTPLSDNINPNDTLFIELEGLDSAPLSKGLAVILAINTLTKDTLVKTLVESSENSGLFRGVVYTSEITDNVNDIIQGQNGQVLKVISRKNSNHQATIIVGDTPDPIISNFTIKNENDLTHILNNTPEFIWSYYDPLGSPQASYQIQISSDSTFSIIDMWDSGVINSIDSSMIYSGTNLSEGVSLFARIQVVSENNIPSRYSQLNFRINSKPTVPLLVSPVYNQIVKTPVTLKILNAVDTENDNLTYSFNLYDDESLTNKIDSVSDVSEDIDTTSWTVTVDLPDNQQYFWTVLAHDGFEQGPASNPSSFILNDINDPPGAFSLLSPAPNIEVTSLTPLLKWKKSVDPDPLDTVYYTLYYGSQITDLQTVDVSIDTFYQIPNPLTDNTIYYWKVVAKDLSGATHENSGGYYQFTVNTKNDLPGDFALLSPLDSAMVTDLLPKFIWEASSDVDKGEVNRSPEKLKTKTITGYKLYVGETTDFTDVIPYETSATNYRLTEPLSEDTYYYWKVEALDDKGGITSSAVYRFWTNSENSVPKPFALISPDHEWVLTEKAVPLQWESSEDADLYDAISYTVKLGTSPTEMTDIYEGPDTVFTTAELNDNTIYYWKVVAKDLSGATRENTGGYHQFTVNTENVKPTAPVIISPDSVIVVNLNVAFHWKESIDINPGDEITYDMHWWGPDTPEDSISTDSNSVKVQLADNSQYFWKVFAYDNYNAFSEFGIATFWTDAFPEPPFDFNTVAPLADAHLQSENVDFIWSKTTDPDPLDEVYYRIVVAKDWNDSDTYIFSDLTTDTTLSMTLTMNDQYFWVVEAWDSDSLMTPSNNGQVYSFVLGSVSVLGAGIPTEFQLAQNYPNPFNPTTTIEYSLPEQADVKLIIYDIRGNTVKQWIYPNQNVGYYSVIWNGTNSSGNQVSTGIYFYRIIAGDFTQTKKMVFMK